MHIKTNIEISSVQMATLAVCPLIMILQNVNDALFLMAGTVICVLLSQIFCLIFNKYLSNNVKVLICALISSLVVIVAEFVSKQFFDYTMIDSIYYIVFSSTVLSVDFIYIRSKAATKKFFANILKSLFLFVLITFIFVALKEFLCFGTFYQITLFSYQGNMFFATATFSLLLLAIICFVLDILWRAVDKKLTKKQMLYQKFVKIIRNEKAFQYDKLRRDKLLTNEIEVNNLDSDDAQKLMQKISENEAIDSVSETIEQSDIETTDDAVTETDEASDSQDNKDAEVKSDKEDQNNSEQESVDDKQKSKNKKDKKGDEV